MDETNKNIGIGQEPETSTEEQAHRFYLDKIGLGDLSGKDVDYTNHLRAMTIGRPISQLNELAGELPESQAALQSPELKLPTTVVEKRVSEELTDRLNRADRSRSGSQDAAVGRTYRSVGHFAKEAYEDLWHLHLAFDNPENADPKVSAERARALPEVKQVIAKYLRVIDSTRRDFWPKRNQDEFAEQEQIALGMAVEICEIADDQTLRRFLESLYKLVENRCRFWMPAIRSANSTTPVQTRILSNPKSTIGSLLPTRPVWSVGEQRGLFDAAAETSIDQVEQTAGVKDERPTREEIMSDHQKRVEERAAYEQQLIDRNWPPGRAQQEAKRRFPIEALDEPVAKRGSHSQDTHSKGKGKGRKTKRYWSRAGKDTGPPLHIIRKEHRGEYE